MYVKLLYDGELEALEKRINKYIYAHNPTIKDIKYVDLPGYDASVLLICEGEEPIVTNSSGGQGSNSYYCGCIIVLGEQQKLEVVNDN